MRIVFCIYEFNTGHLPLQPWLTIARVGERLAARGHDVHIVTDASEPASVSGLHVHQVTSLRGTHTASITELMNSLAPDALVFLPTPLNLVSSGWLDGLSRCRRVGFASYPFYNLGELMRAWHRLPTRDMAPFLKHLMVPNFYWRRAASKRCEALIVQSATTASRLRDWLLPDIEVHTIVPGIELDDWSLQGELSARSTEGLDFLYLGAATPIRGFEVALEALSHVADAHVRLKVLARGADEVAVRQILERCGRLGIQGRVSVEGGWIDRSRLVSEIHAASAVLQPFVLVPSELPVTAMEVIACGTPVIGSAIDGLPSTIGEAGTVFRQGSALALARVLELYARDVNIGQTWRSACRQQRLEMPDWDRVTSRWEEVLHG